MQAAAISPCEWPTTAAGSTPWACHSRASDTITANSNGWTTSGRSYASSGPAPRSVASRSQSVYGASAVAHCSIDAAKTSERSSRSRAMPSHCEPWPGKTSTALRSAAVRGRHHVGRGLARRQRVQGGAQRCPVVADDSGPDVETGRGRPRAYGPCRRAGSAVRCAGVGPVPWPGPRARRVSWRPAGAPRRRRRVRGRRAAGPARRRPVRVRRGPLRRGRGRWCR